MREGLRVGAIVAVLTLVTGSAAAPQAPARPPSGTRPAAGAPPHAPGDVEVEPIKCWWKTDKSAVLVGERFTVTVTCAVIETNKLKVVPDLNQLEPTTVALSPFEVVKGVRHEDIRDAPWRYLQYEYTVRVVGDGFFGKDVDIPALKVTYHVQSAIGGGSQGRDQTYVLPALAVHVHSLLPKKVTDIRDSSADTFADIEARRLRSTGEFVAAAIAFGFAAVLAGLALVRVVGRYRVRTPAAGRPLPPASVLRGCLRAAGRVKADVAREGWTPELAGRALAVFRIAGAIALDRPVAQTIVPATVAGREGQLVLTRGVLRPKRALVSTGTTSGAIARTLGGGNGVVADARTQSMLTDFQESLRVFSAARYGRNGHLDAAALDAALENGTVALRKLRVARLWAVRTAGAIAKSAAGVRGAVWSR